MWYYVQLIIDLLVCIFLFYFVYTTTTEMQKQIDRLSNQLALLLTEEDVPPPPVATRLDFDKEVRFSDTVEELTYELPEKENADE